jgi:hypothetical protein
LRPHLPAPPHRSFTGIKYFAITGAEPKLVYNREVAANAPLSMRNISWMGE